MRQREFDYDDILRRALRTAADGIEPSGDGLERIRARLTTPRPLAAAWLMAGYTDVALPALARAWSALSSLRVWLRPDSGQASQTRAAYRRLAPALVRRYGWLRPAAVASAIVIAVAGGFALSQLPGAISNSGAENLPLGNAGTHPHGGSVNSSAASQFPGPSKTSGAVGGILHPSPSASATCTPSPKRRGTGSHAAPTPTPSRTPRPTPSVTPSPTATASPTPTATGTPTPTPTSTGAPATTDAYASPALSQAGIVPPPKPADPATSPNPGKSTPISSPPCQSGR